MPTSTKTAQNIKQAVPFFIVSTMETSLQYYIEGLGFEMTNHWIDEGKLRWCWLQLGGAAIMLQERHPSIEPQGKAGEGVSICFMCEDAIEFYLEVTSRGIQASIPFVGNGMWVTSLADPDGYHLDFESITGIPEGTEFSA